MAQPHFLSLDKGDIMKLTRYLPACFDKLSVPYGIFKEDYIEYSKEWLRPIYFVAWNLYYGPHAYEKPREWISESMFKKIEDYIIGKDNRPLCGCGCPGC